MGWSASMPPGRAEMVRFICSLRPFVSTIVIFSPSISFAICQEERITPPGLPRRSRTSRSMPWSSSVDAASRNSSCVFMVNRVMLMYPVRSSTM